MLLAQQGWQVDVYEKRPQPQATGAQSKQRSWVLALYPRGIEAIEKAVPGGLPFIKERKYKGLVIGDPREGRRIVLQRPGALLDRTSLANALLDAALAMAGQQQTQQTQTQPQHGSGGAGAPAGSGSAQGRISVHFCHSLDALDVTARSATFVDASGSSSGRPVAVKEWDVLVGADGANSAVRAALCEALPGEVSVKVITEPEAKYKSWYGLPALPVTERLWDPDPLLPDGAVSKGAPGYYFYAVSKSLADGAVAMCQDSDGTYCGYLTLPGNRMAQLTTAQQYEEAIRGCAPCLPDAWVGPLAQQLVETPPSDLPVMRAVSSFAAPSAGVVLIGDARATVTPALGQGVNSALQDAALLAESLAQAPPGPQGIAGALRAYSDARKPEVSALQELELMQTSLLAGAKFVDAKTAGDVAVQVGRKWAMASYFGLSLIATIARTAAANRGSSSAPAGPVTLASSAPGSSGSSGGDEAQRDGKARSVVLVAAPPMSELLETAMSYTEMLAKVRAYGALGAGLAAAGVAAGVKGAAALLSSLG